MYLKHFTLNEEPFATTPDPKFLYRSEMHQEALERIMTSVEQRRGITAIIGEPGLGKSLLIRTLIDGFKKNIRFAWVFNTTMNEREFLKYIIRDFGLKPKGKDLSDLLLELYSFLIKEHEKGFYSLLIVDEAQNLRVGLLELIRQLSNLETARNKLLQVILSGQPQLDVYLEHPALQQLKQRVSLKAKLSRLTYKDTKRYIHHRLAVARAKREDIFTEAAMDAIHEISGGIPRLINQVCDNALMEAAKRNQYQVDSPLVMELLQGGKVMQARQLVKIARRQSAFPELRKELKVKEKALQSTKPEPIAQDEVEAFDAVDLGVLALN